MNPHKTIPAWKALRRMAMAAALVACSHIAARAQTDAIPAQFHQMPAMLNPAAAGQTDYLRIRGTASLQWVGIDGAPRTFGGGADMPLRVLTQRIGLGARFVQQTQGLYSTLAAGIQGAWSFRRFGGRWSVGVDIGLFDQSFKGSEVYIPDGDDYHQGSDQAIPTTDIHGTTIDLGAGIYYTHRYFQAGISCAHINSPTVSMSADTGTAGAGTGGADRYTFRAARTLYFMACGNIPLKNTLFEIVPAVAVASDFTFTTARISAQAIYRRFIGFGLGYSWREAVTATVSAQIRDFYIGYSYGYPTSAISKASSGSHEIVVGYSLKLDMGQKNRNRHRSVRIM